MTSSSSSYDQFFARKNLPLYIANNPVPFVPLYYDKAPFFLLSSENGTRRRVFKRARDRESWSNHQHRFLLTRAFLLIRDNADTTECACVCVIVCGLSTRNYAELPGIRSRKHIISARDSNVAARIIVQRERFAGTTKDGIHRRDSR